MLLCADGKPTKSGLSNQGINFLSKLSNVEIVEFFFPTSHVGLGCLVQGLRNHANLKVLVIAGRKIRYHLSSLIDLTFRTAAILDQKDFTVLNDVFLVQRNIISLQFIGF